MSDPATTQRIAEVHQLLSKFLIKRNAPDPEDAAQEIVLWAWENNMLDKPVHYWWKVARSYAVDQHRERQMLWKIAHKYRRDLLPTEVPLICGPDWRDKFLQGVPEWLIDYYRRSNHPQKERYQAMRWRRQLLGEKRYYPRDKNYCRRGHPRTPENTYVYHWKSGTKRWCKLCRKLLDKEGAQRRKQNGIHSG